MEAGSSSNSASTGSNISEDRKILNRIRTLKATFKDSQLIGREREQFDIIKLITNENQHLEVISVWGMGGIGKTMLVRAMCQNQGLMDQFEKCACVAAMRPLNVDELLRSVALQFGYKDAIDLTRKLENMKYLIVFDDIVSTAEWNIIIPYFPATDTSSRIIVTTRMEHIAKHCSKKEENIYNLRSPGYRDARDLFTKKVLTILFV
jgi:predicted AAA+ superfamily ATPase